MLLASPSISIVIPVLNESHKISGLLSELSLLKPRPEVIVVDGGSSDNTLSLVASMTEKFSVKVVSSEKGRGIQMNSGAERANGDWLLFLHSDSYLSQNTYAEWLKILKKNKIDGGAFDFRLDSNESWCRVVECLVYFRCRWFCLPYGDQGFFIRRRHFEKSGRFKNIPLMEDVEWWMRMRRLYFFQVLDFPLTTSARRMKRRGWLSSGLKNLGLVFLYFFGVPPKTLVKFYT